MFLGLLGILLSLVLLITLAYRGVTIVVAAPLCALVALVFSGAPILANYTEVFMPALAGFIQQYFPMFLTGAIFGRLMTMAGYAKDIAQVMTRLLGPQRAILATVLTTGLLTYGGISLFVVVFVMFPLTRELFRAADIPRRLIPGTIAHGMLTFTMTALPGSPQVQNIIPGQAFQTTTFAAPGLGLLGGAVTFVLGMLWLEYRKRKLMAAGESFTDPTEQERRAGVGDVRDLDGAGAAGAGADGRSPGDGTVGDGGGGDHGGAQRQARTSILTREQDRGEVRRREVPGDDEEQLVPAHHVLSFIPILLVFVVNLSFTMVILPGLNWDYLADEQFGGITLDDRLSTWAVICAMVIAILSILVMNIRHLRWIGHGLVHGAKSALLPIFNTASEVGYGAVIASLAAFTLIRDGIFTVSGNALVATAISTSTISGVTGSASGGMTIALNALGDDLRQLAVDQGISLEAMHRITAMASGGFDSMPHNGAVITLILVCGLTHREAYKDVGVISLLIPVCVTAALVPVVLLVGSF
ncbi:GntP family permease [Citricoccus sp. GCM10030269]|uniref:GntP family permease n=1 Tax=Citricoccus sp. GCM10030269 TaxID=3273388 RepID=UPI00361FC4AF